MTRQDVNLQLVEILRAEMLAYPSLRFSQILLNLGFVEQRDCGIWEDEYYVEPEILLIRVKNHLKGRKE